MFNGRRRFGDGTSAPQAALPRPAVYIAPTATPQVAGGHLVRASEGRSSQGTNREAKHGRQVDRRGGRRGPDTSEIAELVHPEVAQAGQVIFLINDLKHIWITANYEETKIRKVHPGQSVAVYVDAYPSHPLKGRVEQIAAKITDPPFQISDTTKTTQKIPVKILLDQVPGSMVLLPGMSVETKIEVR